MSGDHDKYHMKVEIPNNDDHLNLAYELGYEAAKREWVYLTEAEMREIVDTHAMEVTMIMVELAEAIEAKVREKNA